MFPASGDLALGGHKPRIFQHNGRLLGLIFANADKFAEKEKVRAGLGTPAPPLATPSIRS